ncbi:MAG: hypothetical protein Q8S01_05135 [Ignavibacteria bacterium]|nr:hypothetical protein [Ignavibacteria bacterium]
MSIGIPILMPDGKTFLRGAEMKIPVFTGDNEISLDAAKINRFAYECWLDLRPSNMNAWLKRIKAIMDEAIAISEKDTSSLHVRTKQYWNYFEEISIGRVVSWIFIHEEKGTRMKD